MMHDFEDAIINAVQRKWPDISVYVLCWFHFKKALRSKMEELKFKTKFLHAFLPLFDFLTVVDRELIPEGLEYIREKAKKVKGYKGHKNLVDYFIDAYFKRTWVTKRLIPRWNYNVGVGWEEEM